MIKCPVCKKLVQSLKTNSHIIPRWIVNLPKKNGKFVLVSRDNNNRIISKTSQNSYKADIVCDECENEFANDDSYLTVFRDKYQYNYPLHNFFNGFYILGNREDYFKTKKAIISIFIRYYLFVKKRNETFNGQKHFLSKEEFKQILNTYINNKNIINDSLFHVEISILPDPYSMSYPERQFIIVQKRKHNVLQIHLFGLCFCVFLSKNPSKLHSYFAKYTNKSNYFVAVDFEKKDYYFDNEGNLFKKEKKLELAYDPKKVLINSLIT